MFGLSKVCHETLRETRLLRRSVEELTGRHTTPPMTKAEFYNQVDAEADTDQLKIDCVTVARVLKTAGRILQRFPERQRSAMLRELLD